MIKITTEANRPNSEVLIGTEEVTSRTIMFLKCVLIMTIPLAALNFYQNHIILPIDE